MDELTIRGIDDDLCASLHRLASREGISPNRAALKLLRRGAGLPDSAARAPTVGSSLDHLMGTWTAAEADAMNAALEDFETIDEAAWE